MTHRSTAQRFVDEFPDRVQLVLAASHDLHQFLEWGGIYRDLVQEHTGVDVNEGGHAVHPALLVAPYYVAYCKLCQNLNQPNVLQSRSTARP